jgi:hypothetical protein
MIVTKSADTSGSPAPGLPSGPGWAGPACLANFWRSSAGAGRTTQFQVGRPTKLKSRRGPAVHPPLQPPLGGLKQAGSPGRAGSAGGLRVQYSNLNWHRPLRRARMNGQLELAPPTPLTAGPARAAESGGLSRWRIERGRAARPASSESVTPSRPALPGRCPGLGSRPPPRIAPPPPPLDYPSQPPCAPPSTAVPRPPSPRGTTHRPRPQGEAEAGPGDGAIS